MIAAAAVAVTPSLVHRPALEALAILVTITGLPLLVHAVTPGVRAHRRSVREAVC